MMCLLFINSISLYLLAVFLIVGAVLLYKVFYHVIRRIEE